MRNPFKRRTKLQMGDESVRLNDTLLQAVLYPDAMTLDKAMQIPAFAGCVNLICNTAKTIPIRLYKKLDDERVEPVQDDPRVAMLNQDTNDTLSGANFKGAIIYDYLTGKGGYAYINHQGRHWYSLNYVEADYISFYESQDHIFKDYKILVDAKEFEPYQFLKVLRRTKNGYRGESIVDENRIALAAAYNAAILENTLVKKGGNKRGFLQSDHKLTQENINNLRDAFNRMYSQDSDSIPVLNDGVKFQEASSSSVELQLNENKKQNGTEICKLFMVPPNILAGGATESDWTAFIQYCMVPCMEDFTNALNRDCLLEKEKKDFFFAADFAELTKGNIKTRYEAYQVGLKAGFLQVDEIRRKENMPALGMPFLKLGLQDVLLDPDTGGIYTPNTGKWGSIRDQTPDQEGPEPAAGQSEDNKPPDNKAEPGQKGGEQPDENNNP